MRKPAENGRLKAGPPPAGGGDFWGFAVREKATVSGNKNTCLRRGHLFTPLLLRLNRRPKNPPP